MTSRNVRKNNLITDKSNQDLSDNNINYIEDEQSSASRISNLSKNHIRIKEKQPLKKLSESYAPGSIKRLRKATINSYATTQTLPSKSKN